MSYFRELGRFLTAGAIAHANWERNVSTTILGSRKRLLLLALLCLPIFIVGGYALADDIGTPLPDMLGGDDAYGPTVYTLGIFLGAIVIGVLAGLITGCIGAGGGFIIAPALMSLGIRGIMAVGTDLFHIFAKAIMGATLHGKMGNIAVRVAVFFVAGSLVGATIGGIVNRTLYERDPILSDAFITTVYAVILTGLGIYAMSDYIKSRKKGETGGVHGADTEEIGNMPKKLQAINIPPMISFDKHITPGGRRVSWLFLVIAGVLVGLCAGIMGVGGGFLFFPMFVYGLGVSATTTVGTDIFQIVFTAGYAAISQYAIYGFIFYTLAMGMLLGSLMGIQIGAMVTKIVPAQTIRGFYAMAVLAGAANRLFALPGKLGAMEVLPISQSVGDTLNTIGTVLFFIIIGGFGVWVIGTFLRNIGVLKMERPDRHIPVVPAEETSSVTL